MGILSNDTIGGVIHDVARLLRWEFERRAQAVGLTRSQWSVIVLLLREDGAHQRDLAGMSDVTPITMSGLLQRLERDSWVVRTNDPADRRAKRIFLTAKIKPVLEEILMVVKEVRATVLNGLSDVERAQLICLMLRVRHNMSSIDGGTNPNEAS